MTCAALQAATAAGGTNPPPKPTRAATAASAVNPRKEYINSVDSRRVYKLNCTVRYSENGGRFPTVVGDYINTMKTIYVYPA